MNKEFQYTYNEVNFREKMQLLVDKLTHKHADAGSYITLISMFVLTGSAFLYFNSDGPGIIVGPLLLITGIAFSLRLFNYYHKRKQYITLFKKSMDAVIERLNKTDGNLRVSLSDKHFSYGDQDFETKLKWELIQSYLIIDDHLYMMSDNEETNSCYVISAEDIGISDFNEVCEFVQLKLELHHLGNSESKAKKENPDILDN